MHVCARQLGFSLIELMIVVLIIGISASMAVLYIDNSDERLKSEARRLFAMTQLARDDAIIMGQNLGLVVNQKHYSFTRLEQGKWLPIEKKPYRVFDLSDDIKLRLLTADKTADAPKKLAKTAELIYFLSTGESREFQIWISNENDSEYVLSGNISGELTLKKVEVP